MPDVTPSPSLPPPASHGPARFGGHVLYPNEYVWFVFVASLDIMLTWAILRRGGEEVNPIARLVIDNWQLPGAIVFKFGLTFFVILVCEFIGRQGRERLGRGLATLAVGVSSFPVTYSLILLSVSTWVGF